MIRLLISLFFLFASTEVFANRLLEQILPGFEQFVIDGMRESHVPGLSIAIVQQDRMVYVKGFGYRDVEKNLKTTPETVFQLASVSKPVTSTILASLVDSGKIKWDSKIADLDPSFALNDPWVSAHLTIKDLLSHRSGLPDHAGDILEDLGYNRTTILRNMRFIWPLLSFRETYAYTNFGYSEAAFAAARHLGTTWDQLAKYTLFTSLGMDSTTTTFKDYSTNSNRATPYVITDGIANALKNPRDPDAQSPAGGINSTAVDMAKWMILQMGGYQDLGIASNAALAATHLPVIVTGVDSATSRPSFYGMGWGVSYDTDGKVYLKHSGGFALGVRTQVALLPEEKLGIIVLANASPTGLPEAVTKAFFDLYNGKSVEEGLVKKFDQLWIQTQTEPFARYTVTRQEFTPSLALDNYTGTYRNDYFGDLVIGNDGTNLFLTIGPKNKLFVLKHLTRDVFTFVTEGENRIGEAQVQFKMNGQSLPVSLTVDYFNKYGMGQFNKL